MRAKCGARNSRGCRDTAEDGEELSSAGSRAKPGIVARDHANRLSLLGCGDNLGPGVLAPAKVEGVIEPADGLRYGSYLVPMIKANRKRPPYTCERDQPRFD